MNGNNKRLSLTRKKVNNKTEKDETVSKRERKIGLNCGWSNNIAVKRLNVPGTRKIWKGLKAFFPVRKHEREKDLFFWHLSMRII